MKPLILTLTFCFLLLLSPLSLNAQTLLPDTFTDPSVNADGTISSGFVPCSGTTCSTCDFVVMANTIIKWLFGMAFLFFAVLAVVAGVKLVTSGGNPAAKSSAKSSFTNAFIGLFIIMAAWLLVDTIMRNLLGTNGALSNGNIEVSNFGPWAKVKCGEDQAVPKVTVNYYDGDNEYVGATTVSGTSGGTSVTPVGAGGMVSLRSLGVNVANWNGTNGPGRTDKVHPTVAQAVLNMQNQGKAANGGRVPFQVTAAYTNNVGHSANSQHYKGTAVDLQPVNGGTYNQIIQLCKAAGFTFINDERSANHIHCDMR